ncbi:MAG: hypothetical protein AB7G75_34075 [Candidatus Binatia bacterium]
MKDVQALLTQCRQLGVELIPTANDKLTIRAPSPLPEVLVKALQQCKMAILTMLTAPHINTRGELIIPSNCDSRYRWWAGGQSVAQTLAELNAPAEVWRRYVPGYKDTLQ